MELLPLASTSEWTSGTNAHATVLVPGLLGRSAGVEDISAGLQRTDVLIAGIWLTVTVIARVRRGWRGFRHWLQPA